MTDHYVRRWFLRFDDFCARIGAPPELLSDLIAAGAMPGAIYAVSPGDPEEWWSALDECRPPWFEPAQAWYAPAAIWWGRRALLALRVTGSIDAAAAASKGHFVAGFVDELAKEPFASIAFPAAFAEGKVDRAAAEQCAASEWADWIDGGYAICLQRFSAESCVRKESLARRLRQHFEDDTDRALSSDDLFDLVERLEALLLPFAPWQRATCTPGRVIDPALAALDLGAEQPYAQNG